MVAEAVTLEDLQPLFNKIAAYYEGLLARIGNAIESVFLELATKIDNLFTRVIASLETIVNNIAEVVGDIFGKIEEFIQTTINEILLFVDEVLTDIVTNINKLIGDTAEFTKQMIKEVVSFIETLTTDASQLFVDIFDTVTEEIEGIVGEVFILFSEIFDVVVTAIEKVMQDVELQLKGLFGVVRQGVEGILGRVSELIEAIKQGVQELIASLVNEISGALRNLLATISDLPGEIADLTARLVDSSRENIGNPLTSLPLNLITSIVERISGEPLADADRMQLETMNMVFGTSPVERSPEMMRDILTKFMPSHPVVKMVVTTLLAPLIILSTLGGITSANSQILLQEHALENPYRLIEPPDVVRAWYMDLMETEPALEELQRHGFTLSASETMLAVGETLPPEAEQISWFLRGLINEEQFEEGLIGKGWTIGNINLLREAAFFIPPVQDLISMAVREVFTPAIAERFGQYEDLPPDFVSNAAKQGVSSEWATNYWAAHWALPSVQMGFEMLHRRVITEDDLNLLLRSADVMPFWRDKLVAISFAPLTRVDIRRMHKLDVLSEAEVLSAYQDIGYNPENAQRLLDFTIQLNKPSQAQDDQDLSALTRNNIINFYSDGVLSRVKATSLLVDIGLSLDAADLFLDGADMQLQRKERRDEIEIILDRADSGVLTFEQAQDALNRLGLQTLEIQIALSDLAKREAKRTKLPSRADLDKMLKKDIIDARIYIDTVRRIGYSNEWAQRYLKLVQG